MTPSEFKAWFDGFTEALDDLPSGAQWKRIKERVAEIDGKPVTERVYIDRYLPYIRPWITGPYYSPAYNPAYWTYCQGLSDSGVGGTTTNNIAGLNQQYQNSLQNQMSGLSAHYNSGDAMNALGRAEAQAMQ